jgi:hypothetical protein
VPRFFRAVSEEGVESFFRRPQSNRTTIKHPPELIDEIMFPALNNSSFWASIGHLSIDFASKRDRMVP